MFLVKPISYSTPAPQSELLRNGSEKYVLCVELDDLLRPDQSVCIKSFRKSSNLNLKHQKHFSGLFNY